MEIYAIQRPSVLPAVCAPVSGVRVLAAAAVPQLPQAHQAPVQAELASVLVPADGGFGINGFLGGMGAVSAKQRRTDARGVPPRGRPV